MAKVALSYGHGENTFEDKHSKGVVVNGKAYEEHHFNAEVGTRVKKIIEAHGVQVLEVQAPFKNDVALATRVKNANDWKADIYWSIHANAAGKAARGLAAFYYKGSKEGKKLAELYAKYCAEAKFPVYSDDYMFESQPDTWSDFFELRETDMPACLTENGFMTNPEDFKLIFKNEDNFWNRLAYAHSKVILEYFGIKYDPYKSGEKQKPAPKPTAPAKTHKIVKGDTFWSIAKKFGITVQELQLWNPGVDPVALQPGDVLKVVKPKLIFTSLVDYLSSEGQPYDFVSRVKLAAKHGIKDYNGTAEQNTKLLDILQK